MCATCLHDAVLPKQLPPGLDMLLGVTLQRPEHAGAVTLFISEGVEDASELAHTLRTVADQMDMNMGVINSLTPQ